MTRAVAIDELRAAYQAVQSGVFRTATLAASATPASASEPSVRSRWEPSGRVLLVAGCMGSAGASTVALLLATALGDARVVECCTVTSSGLCGAANAELGTVGGWVRGSRDRVVIERRGDRIPSRPPFRCRRTPISGTRCWTTPSTSTCWPATRVGWGSSSAPPPRWCWSAGPACRGCAGWTPQLLGAERAVAVVIGSKRWPKALEQAASPAVRRLRAEGRLFCLPTVPGLAMAGLTPEPLPAAIVAAASDLVTFWKGTRS